MPSAPALTIRFTRTTLALMLGAVAIACMSWQAGANAAGRPPATPTAVAVVNLPRVLQSLDERNVRQEAMSASTAVRQKQLDELTKRIEALSTELDPKTGTLKPGTTEYRDKVIQLRELQVTLDARFKLLEQVLSFERGTIMRELYLKIEDAVRRIADRNGYDVVILDDTDFKLPEEASQDDMNRAILARSVVYRHDSVDITDQVVLLMNNEFQAGAKP